MAEFVLIARLRSHSGIAYPDRTGVDSAWM